MWKDGTTEEISKEKILTYLKNIRRIGRKTNIKQHTIIMIRKMRLEQYISDGKCVEWKVNCEAKLICCKVCTDLPYRTGGKSLSEQNMIIMHLNQKH